jgi:16S rRNA processing protein RimM
LTADARPLEAGRVGRPHGLDGSFYVEEPAHPLTEGTEVVVGEVRAKIDRRAGSDARPLVRLEGVTDRGGAQALRGQTVLIPGGREQLGVDEWYDDDLIGCRVEGLGEVRAVLHGPSCDLLEVGDDRILVPLVRDAVPHVDLERRVIEVDRAFLNLDSEDRAP